MELLAAFFAPILVYLFIFILNATLPGRWVVGYVKKSDSNEKLRYRLNGLLVLFTVVFCWVLLCFTGLMPLDWQYKFRWYGLAGANT